jgi:hypothetical protein
MIRDWLLQESSWQIVLVPLGVDCSAHNRPRELKLRRLELLGQEEPKFFTCVCAQKGNTKSLPTQFSIAGGGGGLWDTYAHRSSGNIIL